MSARRRRRKNPSHSPSGEAVQAKIQAEAPRPVRANAKLPLELIFAVAAIGFIVFASIFGVAILNPTYYDWLLARQDPSQHFLGPHFFRHEPWQFPIGLIKQIHAPDGASIFYTDSVPLLAILLKILSPLLPHWIQYIGPWMAACFMLNAFFGAALVFRLTQQKSAALFAAAFFALAPMLVNRLPNHSAGAAHWLVIAALYLYFLPDQKSTRVRWLVLTTAAIAIHSYMFAMVWLIFTAYLVKQLQSDFRGKVLPLTFLGAIASGLVLLVLWQTGYFLVSSPPGAFGNIGRWSMNLLAPFLPTPHASLFLPSTSWAISEQNFEGFAYLGFGVLGLLAFAVFAVLRSKQFGLPKRHWPLAVVLFVCAVYATAHRFSLGSLILYDAQWPAGLVNALSALRCNGRLFTPVYYMLIAFSLVAVFRHLPQRRATAFLTLALIIQIADLWPIYKKVNVEANYESPLTSPIWSTLGKAYDEIRVVPPGNPVVAPSILQPAYVPLYLLAEQFGMNINVFYLSRFDIQKRHAYANRLTRELNQGILDSRALYIVQPEKKAADDAPKFSFETRRGVLDGYYVIAP